MHLSTGFLRTTHLYEEDIINQSSFFRKMLTSGEAGVNIFFVISGFILALPFAKHYLNFASPINLKTYYMRRLTRLEPPYLITLTLFLLVHLVVVNRETISELLPHFIASFFYSHSLIYGKITPINPVTWSLEIEVQFYMLVPLLVLIFKLKPRVVRIAVLIFLILLYYTVFENLIPKRSRLTLSLLSYYPYFLTGFIMAEIYLSRIFMLKGNVKRHYFFDIIGIVSIGMIFIVFELFKEFHVTLPFLILLVFYSAFYGKALNAFFSNSIIATIGGMCYIIYLIHYPLVYFLMFMFSEMGFGKSFVVDILLQYLILVPIILSISGVLFLILEKPFMYKDWPLKVIRRMKRLRV